MKNELKRMKKAIFSGLSYMIPLVAGSGLLMAFGVILSIALGYDPSGSEFAWSIDGNALDQLIHCRFDQLIWWTGKFGLNLMAPFIAAVNGFNAVLMYTLAYAAGVLVAVVLTTILLRARYHTPETVWFEDEDAGFDL